MFNWAEHSERTREVYLSVKENILALEELPKIEIRYLCFFDYPPRIELEVWFYRGKFGAEHYAEEFGGKIGRVCDRCGLRARKIRHIVDKRPIVIDYKLWLPWGT